MMQSVMQAVTTGEKAGWLFDKAATAETFELDGAEHEGLVPAVIQFGDVDRPGGGKAGKEALRDHRNILIHRIGSPKKVLVDKLLSGAPTLAEKLLRAIGAALPLGSSSADAIISDALADLPLSTIQAVLPAE